MWGSGSPGGGGAGAAAVTVVLSGTRDCFLHLPPVLASHLCLQQVPGGLRSGSGRRDAAVREDYGRAASPLPPPASRCCGDAKSPPYDRLPCRDGDRAREPPPAAGPPLRERQPLAAIAAGAPPRGRRPVLSPALRRQAREGPEFRSQRGLAALAPASLSVARGWCPFSP